MNLLIGIFIIIVVFLIYKFYKPNKSESNAEWLNKTVPPQLPEKISYYIEYDGRMETGQQYPFNIVGEASYQHNINKFVVNRGDRSVFTEIEAVIQHEPTNTYDPNACKVMIQGLTVGYFAKNHAKSWLGLLERQQIPVMSLVQVKAVIVGGGSEQKHYGIRLEMPERIANVSKYLSRIKGSTDYLV